MAKITPADIATGKAAGIAVVNKFKLVSTLVFSDAPKRI
jgi:hypothetical protein